LEKALLKENFIDLGLEKELAAKGLTGNITTINSAIGAILMMMEPELNDTQLGIALLYLKGHIDLVTAARYIVLYDELNTIDQDSAARKLISIRLCSKYGLFDYGQHPFRKEGSKTA